MSRVQALIQAFEARKGEFLAMDAETGVESPVTQIQDLSSPERRSAHFSVTLASGKVYEFQSEYDHKPTLGRYLEIAFSQPGVPDAEVTEVRILTNGSEDYPVFMHGSGSFDATLALTITHLGAVERNQPLIEAYEVKKRDERDKQRKENADRLEAERAHHQAARAEQLNRYREAAVLPLLEVLQGKAVEDLTIEDGVVTLAVKGAPPVRFAVRSVGFRAGGGIVDHPEVTVDCGTHHLSGHASIYFRR